MWERKRGREGWMDRWMEIWRGASRVVLKYEWRFLPPPLSFSFVLIYLNYYLLVCWGPLSPPPPRLCLNSNGLLCCIGGAAVNHTQLNRHQGNCCQLQHEKNGPISLECGWRAGGGGGGCGVNYPCNIHDFYFQTAPFLYIWSKILWNFDWFLATI